MAGARRGYRREHAPQPDQWGAPQQYRWGALTLGADDWPAAAAADHLCGQLGTGPEARGRLYGYDASAQRLLYRNGEFYSIHRQCTVDGALCAYVNRSSVAIFKLY